MTVVTTASQDNNNSFTGANSHSGTETFTGAETHSGADVFKTLNGIRFADQFASLSAAIADLPAGGGTVYIPHGYTETQSGAFHFTKSNVNIVALGTATITNTAGWFIDAGVNHVAIESLNPWGMDSNGTNTGLTFAGYTGSGVAFQIGTAAANTFHISLKNVHVDLSAAAAGATALKFLRVQFLNIDNFATAPSADSQTGIDSDGTGNFNGFVKINNPWITSGASGTNATGIRSGPLTNALEVSGGDITLIQAGTSRGLVADGGEMWLDFPNVNTAVTACVTLKNGSNNGRISGKLRVDSGVTNGANFGNGTLGSHILNVNSTVSVPVTDTGGASNNGTNSFNSFYTPDSFWFNNQKWAIYGPSNGNFTVKDVVNSKTPLQIVANGNMLLSNAATQLTIDNGPRFYIPESSAGAGVASQSLLQSSSTTHRLMMNNNNTGAVMIIGTDANTSQKAESAADASVLSFTPPAAAGTYRLRFNLSLSAASAAVLGWTATWKDANGNAKSPTNLSLYQVGTATPALTFTTSTATDEFYGDATIDIDNTATAIVIKLTLGSGTFTGKASATIERLI